MHHVYLMVMVPPDQAHHQGHTAEGTLAHKLPQAGGGLQGAGGWVGRQSLPLRSLGLLCWSPEVGGDRLLCKFSWVPTGRPDAL